MTLLAEEEAGQRDKPSAAHPCKGNGELLLCNKKLSICMSGFENWRRERTVENLEEQILFQLRSRSVHVFDRLTRLAVFAPNLNVDDSIEQAGELLDKIEKGLQGEFSPLPAAPTATVVYNQGNADAVQNQGDGRRNEDLQGDMFPRAATGQGGAVPKTTVTNSWSTTAGLAGGARPSDRFRAPDESQNDLLNSWNFPTSAPLLRPLTIPAVDQQIPRQAIPVDPGTNLRNRQGLSQALCRWTVRFGGGKKDLPIDEFFFRVENLAAADNIAAPSVVLGLHFLLSDRAADFYWVHRRKFPNASYRDVKRSMIAHFSRQDNDFELRKSIMSRRQNPREEFVDFCLEIECMAARLTRPMEEEELLEILRQNMSSRLQDRLLLQPTNSIDELKSVCQRFERMWCSLAEQAKDRNFTGRLAELGFDSHDVEHDTLVNHQFNSSNVFNQSEENRGELAEVSHNRRSNCDHVICWNCDDIGHSFTDCQSPLRKIFCYGCGCKNVYKPNCQKCNPKNLVGNGAEPRRPRHNPFSAINQQSRQQQ